jgi:hypothetical protein
MRTTEQPQVSDPELNTTLGAIHRLEKECRDLARCADAAIDEAWPRQLATFLAAFDDCVAACKYFVDWQTGRVEQRRHDQCNTENEATPKTKLGLRKERPTFFKALRIPDLIDLPWRLIPGRGWPGRAGRRQLPAADWSPSRRFSDPCWRNGHRLGSACFPHPDLLRSGIGAGIANASTARSITVSITPFRVRVLLLRRDSDQGNSDRYQQDRRVERQTLGPGDAR